MAAYGDRSKFNQGHGGVFFTSDLHLLHPKVAGIRGFDNVTDHDEMICERWVETVKPKDQIWVLGDLAMSDWKGALEMIDKLPGRKHLISGNHDQVHPMHSTSEKYQRRYMEVFESVQMASHRKLDGRRIVLSHFPYCTDRDPNDIRYMQWRLRDEGLWLLHGHLHMKMRVSAIRHELHVGVEAWDFKPVSINSVLATIIEAENEEI
jgi:calcineurin-like phosphoesterase family protein